VGTTEEILEGKVAAPVQKTEINDRGNMLRWPRDSLYPQKLALTLPKSGGRSVGIVRSRTKATEFSFFFQISATITGDVVKIWNGCLLKVNKDFCPYTDVRHLSEPYSSLIYRLREKNLHRMYGDLKLKWRGMNLSNNNTSKQREGQKITYFDLSIHLFYGRDVRKWNLSQEISSSRLV
jgi:hypothetical protein